jgi:Transposase, Mutator family
VGGSGLSASAVQRLTREWSQELQRFGRRDLSQVDYVYLWADGVHFNIRPEEDWLCCLVLVGVRADGSKELVAVGDGYRRHSGGVPGDPSAALLGALRRPPDHADHRLLPNSAEREDVGMIRAP